MGTPTIPNIRVDSLVEDSQVTVWWAPPSTGFPLSYRLTLNPGSLVYSVPGTWQQYLFRGLTNGTQYIVTIQATNDGSTYGPIATFNPFVPDGVPTIPPQNATALPVGSNGIQITWSPPAIAPLSPIRCYLLTGQSADPSVSTLTYTQPASGGTSVVIPNVNTSAIYTFTIRAVNDVGISPATTTNPVAFTQSYGIPDWAVSNFANINAGGNNFRNFHCGIACDTQNNIYIVGQCSHSTLNLFNYHSTLGNGTISTTRAGIFISTGLVYTTAFFTYVVKYTSSGQVAWFAPILNGGNNSARPSGICTDRGNNVYISYEIAGGLQYRLYNAQVPGTSGFISTGTEYGRFSPPSIDVALVKYNSNGIIQWATLNGGGIDSQFSEQRNSIVTDSQCNVYSLFYSSNFSSTLLYSATGVINGIIQLSTVARFMGDADPILAHQSIFTKHDSNGQFQWAIESPLYYQANHFTLAIDSNDNIFLPTNLSSPSTVVYSYAGISSGIISTSIFGRLLKGSNQFGLDGLVIKYNSNGQAQWVVQQNTSTVNTSVPPRTIATDIYGNLYTLNTTPNSTSIFMTYNSFLRVTNDLYISTVSSASVTGNYFYIGKYDSNGQFVTCAAQSIGSGVSLNNSGTLMTDYLGNVYSITNDSTNAGFGYIMRDYYNKDSNNNVNFKEWGGISMTSFGLCTTLRKMNNNLETQYGISFSNLPYLSTTFITTSNMCIDRNNYVYIAGTAQVSSLIDVPVQSSLPLPLWNGVPGGPYSVRTNTNNPGTVSISSIITSTTTYSFLMKYK
jgi:hypothetical protein